MHVIPPVAPRFILTRGSLRLGEFTSLYAIGRHLSVRVVREMFYHELNDVPQLTWPGQYSSGSSALQVRDAEGDFVTWRTVLRACRELEPAKRRLGTNYFWSGVGPVPGTGRSRGYRFKRRPQTSQELRLIAGVVHEDGEPVWRASRRDIPTVWDDLILRPDHSWKRHRRTRWK